MHNKRDVVSFMSTSFEIISFKESTPILPDLDELYVNKTSNNPKLKNLLDKIVDELRGLE